MRPGGAMDASREFGMVVRQTEIQVQAKRRCDLVLEELSEAAALWIDTPQQLALVEPERQRVVRLPRAGLPRRLLTRQHRGQAIEIGDDAPIDRFVDGEQSGLVCQELAHGNALLALLRELRPVRADAFLVVEPSARVGDGERHRRQPFGGGMDDHHRVLLPGLSRLLVSAAAPEIDGDLATVKRTARAAQLVASREVVGKRFAHRLEPTTDLAVHARSVPHPPRPISAASSAPQQDDREHHDPEQEHADVDALP